MIKICKPQTETNLDSVNDRLKVIEDLIESGNLTKETYEKEIEENTPAQPASEKKMKNEATEAAMNLPKATIDDLKNINSLWQKVVRALPEMFTACLRKATPSVRPDDGKLMISFEDDMIYR